MEKIKISKTEDLLRELDPANEKWDNWYFRGQPNETWTLLPSVWREEQIQDLLTDFTGKIDISKHEKNVKITIDGLSHKLKNTINYENVCQWVFRVKLENYLLHNFIRTANNSGLLINNEELIIAEGFSYYWTQEVLDWPPYFNLDVFLNQYLERYKEKKRQIPESANGSSPLRFEASLPQHYGLPTRILDWTTDPRKACFFAAYYHLTRPDRLEGDRISIYAINIHNTQGIVKKLNCQMRYRNQFLHVQDGLFTETYGDFFYLDKGCWPSIEDFKNNDNDKNFELIKYTFPAELSTDLLKRLEKCGITISKMMPDYSHVAEQVCRIYKPSESAV